MYIPLFCFTKELGEEANLALGGEGGAGVHLSPRNLAITLLFFTQFQNKKYH